MDVLSTIKPELEREFAQMPEVTAAYLLGSVIRGGVHTESDVDVAILIDGGKGITAWERLRLEARLEQCIDYPVDIGVLTKHNLVYVKETSINGVCIFCRDRFQRDIFIATALGLYLELHEERKEVENAYRIR